MKYTLNGSTVILGKDIITEESLNTMIKEIDSSYNSCSKAIETYNLVSNVKAVESFGYKATEGLGESIKNGAKAILEKIKEFFKRISLFVNSVSSRIKSAMFKKKCEETVKILKSSEMQKVLALPNNTESIMINNDVLKLFDNVEVVEECISKLNILYRDMIKYGDDLCEIFKKYENYSSDADVNTNLSKMIVFSTEINIDGAKNIEKEIINNVHNNKKIKPGINSLVLF